MSYRLSPLALLTAACISVCLSACMAPPRTAPAPEPTPTTPEEPAPPPEPPTPTPELPGATEWRFTYTPTPVSYLVTTTGTLTQLPDSISPSQDSLPENSLPESTERITIQYTPSTTGTITTVLNPPPPTPGPCNDTAALHSRAQSLLPKLPNYLTIGMTWSDSLTTTGCRGPVVATVQARYEYQVAGDTVFLEQPTLLIRRTELVQASGEGNLGQHRIVIDAQGTALSQFFLDVTTGTLTGIIRTDSTRMTVQTSGRRSQFLQHSVEVVHRDPAQR